MEYQEIMKESPLFAGIEKKDLSSMLNCLSAQEKHYAKEDYILHVGDHISSIGLVIRGKVLIIKEDFWGNRAIIGDAEPGDLFGEAYACVQGSSLTINAVADEDTTIYLMDVGKILTTCPNGCVFHTRLIRNLLSVLAGKNLMLTQKMEHMVQKTTREKLLSYLSAQSIKKGNADFDIPFNRQQLADYLSVDRSAMSNELCKMRDEGLLTFERSHFHLS